MLPALAASTWVVPGPGSWNTRAPRNRGGHPGGCFTGVSQGFLTAALPDTDTTKPCRTSAVSLAGPATTTRGPLPT
jgi:hypothetical protein